MYRRAITGISLFLLLLLTGCASLSISQGDEHLKMKHYYDAARNYITALSYDENNTEVKGKLSQIAHQAYDEKLDLAKDYEKNGNQELALVNYEELSALMDGLNKYVGINFPVINARQKNLDLRNKLAEGYYGEGEKSFSDQDYPTAIYKFNRALYFVKPYKDSTEKIAESHYRMGKEFQMKGDYRQAAESFEKSDQVVYGYKDAKTLFIRSKSMADENDARVHYSNGLELADQDKYEDAIQEMKLALAYVPHYRNAEELIEKYNRLVQDAEAEQHYDRGLELMAERECDEAKKEFDQALALIPNYKNAKGLAERCQKDKDTEEAQQHYEKGMELATAQDYWNAAEEFDKAVAIMPNYRNAKALAEKYRAMAQEKDKKDQEKH